MQNLEHSDRKEKLMGEKTTHAVVQSQHECMVVRLFQEAYVEAQQSVQELSSELL